MGRGPKSDIVTAEASIDDIQGPTERKLKAARWEKERQEIAAGSDAAMAAALRDYEAAEKLFEAGQYREAEKAFKAVAKARQTEDESFASRWQSWWGLNTDADFDPTVNFGDPIEEDAIFMIAESQFAQKRFASAQDSYDELLNRFPSTRHLDRVTRQMFRIARYWLEFPEQVNDRGDVTLASHTNSESSAPAMTPPKRLGLVPNFTDRSRPVFDTYGRALQALRSIWLHDATGPLADDALMLAANHNLRTGNYQEAARLYKLLREQYPDSPHFKDSFLLGSHVTLASYQGPGYDGKSLEEARNLKQASLQLFPNLPPEQRERLQEEIRRLENAEIARLWDLVEFYQTKRVDESVALHCYLIINRYPDSEYAERARGVLKEIEARRQRAAEGGSSWWSSSRRQENRAEATPEPQAAPAMPQKQSGGLTMPLPRSEGHSVNGDDAPAESTDRRGFWRGLNNMLRRTNEPPELQPIESSDFPPLEAGPPAEEPVGRATL